MCVAVVGWLSAFVSGLPVFGRVCIKVVGIIRHDIKPVKLSPCKLGVRSVASFAIKGEIAHAGLAFSP